MSPAEVSAVRRFVAAGGTVIADCRTALMDSHCRILPRGQLDDLFGIERADTKFAPGAAGLLPAQRAETTGAPKALDNVAAAEPGTRVLPGATALYRDSKGTPAVIVRNHQKGRTIYLNAVITDYHRWRMRPPEGESVRLLVDGILRQAGVSKQYDIVRSDSSPATAIEIHPFRSGDLRVLGVHRNYGLRVSELGPSEYQKQDALDIPMELTVRFPAEVSLYDARQRQSLGRRREYTFKLDKTQPTLLAILPTAVSAPAVQAPLEARRGALVEIPIEIKGESAGTSHAIRVRLLDPNSKELRMLTQTLAAPGGKTVWELPLAMNLPEGRYTAEVVDIPSGSKSTQAVTVR
jgi:hypothetical protein